MNGSTGAAVYYLDRLLWGCRLLGRTLLLSEAVVHVCSAAERAFCNKPSRLISHCLQQMLHKQHNNAALYAVTC